MLFNQECFKILLLLFEQWCFLSMLSQILFILPLLLQTVLFLSLSLLCLLHQSHPALLNSLLLQSLLLLQLLLDLYCKLLLVLFLGQFCPLFSQSFLLPQFLNKLLGFFSLLTVQIKLFVTVKFGCIFSLITRRHIDREVIIKIG